jgi:hypothetical protein
MLYTGEIEVSDELIKTQINHTTGEKEFLVWQKDTWGRFGQHYNIYTFVIDLSTLEQKAIFELVEVRHENKDSRKNYHRFTYVKQSELRKLAGKVIKYVVDYASSSKRVITANYFIVDEGGELKQLQVERSLRDANGFYDKVYLPDGRILINRKDKVEVR